ncbi:MAG TPA: CPBP family intramembrane glutamic endopeptidase [Allosphingosinicella sp.]|nr:CPBP family intramembrane glutamic endopeptidase [Allosphingosinicella sp.]
MGAPPRAGVGDRLDDGWAQGYTAKMTTARPIIWWKALVGILAVILLAAGLPIGGAILAAGVTRILHLPVSPGDNLAWLYWQHAGQTLLAIVAILIAKRLVPGDYGLHLPKGKTYLGPAIACGIAFGLIMTLVDYWPQLMTHAKPALSYPLTTPNVAGWLFFEGVYVGPTEEIPFRALLVPLLAGLFPARLKLGRFDMYWAGIIVAALFALAHASSFETRPFAQALGQQVYAFALGVLYAYWLEKSRSVLAAAVCHNVGDVLEYGLTVAWIAWL